jgi:hypothetical protein
VTRATAGEAARAGGWFSSWLATETSACVCGRRCSCLCAHGATVRSAKCIRICRRVAAQLDRKAPGICTKAAHRSMGPEPVAPLTTCFGGWVGPRGGGGAGKCLKKSEKQGEARK